MMVFISAVLLEVLNLQILLL